MDGRREKKNRIEKIINKTIQVFPEQKCMRFQNGRVHQVPNTMDDNRPRNSTEKFLNTGDHWDQKKILQVYIKIK